MGELPAQSCFTGKEPKQTNFASSSEERIDNDESHSPEREHNTFENESKHFWGLLPISLVSFLNQSLSLREGLRQAINTGLTRVLPVSQAPQNLFDDAENGTTSSESIQACQI